MKPTPKPRTLEEWKAEAERLAVELNQARAELNRYHAEQLGNAVGSFLKLLVGPASSSSSSSSPASRSSSSSSSSPASRSSSSSSSSALPKTKGSGRPGRSY